jgi:branched-chain amino acid transport system substrate-binding protein
MRKSVVIPIIIVVVIVAVVAAVLNWPRDQNGEVPTEILIGTPAPMTGVFAGFGEGCVFGMQAAVDDINAQGGLYVEEYGTKLPVRLIVSDCESDPVKVGTIAEDLCVTSKVHALLSPDEPVTIHGPVATVADKYKVPHLIGGGPFEPWNGQRMEVTPPWEYSWLIGFRIVMPYPEGDFRDVPGYTIKDSWFQMLDMFADQTNKVAGVFASDDPDGIGWYGLFPDALEDYGLTVVGAEENLGLFPMGTTDFTPIISEWKANNVTILWGNCPGADFGTMWKQCNSQGFKPKIVTCGRAPLFYVDASSWGGDLPWGVGVEVWWDRVYPADSCPGIGNTTAESLTQRWIEDTGQPLNPAIGHGYLPMQVMLDAIERAGTLDSAAINNAIAETDMLTINGRVKFIQEEQFSGLPLFVGQWVKTNKPQVWDLQITFSQHDWLEPAHEPIFPLP